MALEIDVACYDPEDECMLQVSMGLLDFDPVNTDVVLDPDNFAALTLGPGASSTSFYFGQWFPSGLGSEWHLYFYDRNNPEDRELLTLYMGECDPTNAVEDLPELAASAAYPNPAQNTVSIDFQTSAFPVQLQVYDVLGNVVKDLTLEQPQGTAQVDVSDLSDGMYFYHLSAEGYRSEVTPLVVAH